MDKISTQSKIINFIPFVSLCLSHRPFKIRFICDNQIILLRFWHERTTRGEALTLSSTFTALAGKHCHRFESHMKYTIKHKPFTLTQLFNMAFKHSLFISQLRPDVLQLQTGRNLSGQGHQFHPSRCLRGRIHPPDRPPM